MNFITVILFSFCEEISVSTFCSEEGNDFLKPCSCYSEAYVQYENKDNFTSDFHAFHFLDWPKELNSLENIKNSDTFFGILAQYVLKKAGVVI